MGFYYPYFLPQREAFLYLSLQGSFKKSPVEFHVFMVPKTSFVLFYHSVTSCSAVPVTPMQSWSYAEIVMCGRSCRLPAFSEDRVQPIHVVY